MHIKIYLFRYKMCHNQSGTLYQSSNNYLDDDVVTRSSNFLFFIRGRQLLLQETEFIHFHFRKRVFISAFCFKFIKNLHEILNFSIQSGNFFYSSNQDIQVFNRKISCLFQKKFRQTPVLAFEFCISWLAGRQNYLVRQQFRDQETL